MLKIPNPVRSCPTFFPPRAPLTPRLARTAESWKNWAGTVTIRGSIAKPRSYPELLDVMRRFKREGRLMRAVAAGHSWSEGTIPDYTDGTDEAARIASSAIIVLGPENFAAGHLTVCDTGCTARWDVPDDFQIRVVKANGQAYAVVPPGTPQFVLVEAGRRFHNVYVPGAGAVEDVTLGWVKRLVGGEPLAGCLWLAAPALCAPCSGFVANGCHGTGLPPMTGASIEDPGAPFHGAVSESVGALEILSFNAEGELVRTCYGETAAAIKAAFDEQCDWAKGLPRTDVSGEDNRGLWDSVKAHLGAFGIISRIAFKAQVRRWGWDGHAPDGVPSSSAPPHPFLCLPCPPTAELPRPRRRGARLHGPPLRERPRS